MKKETLLGMEVYYEDNPQPVLPPKPGQPSGVWVFGDSDEEDDFNEKQLEDWDVDFSESDDPWGSHTLGPPTPELVEHDEKDFAVIMPVKGRIYRVRGLNIVARLKEIRPLTVTAGIFEMDRYGSKFYINPSDLKRASREEVESYLED